MERSSRRGKIPQKDWPSIIARHEAGETLASIARTYDCSAPAISYIVSRTRARVRAAEGARTVAAPAEKEAAKTPSPEPEATRAAENRKTNGPGAAAQEPQASSEPRRKPESSLFDGMANGRGAGDRNAFVRREAAPGENGNAPRPENSSFPSANGGQRRILHLSLGAAGQGDGAAGHSHSPQHRQNAENGERAALPSNAATARPANTPFPGNRGTYEPAGVPRRPEQRPAKDTPVALDPALRQRVSADIAAFLSAFDGALAQDTAESRTELREATDRLLRAGARTRIELERLEARLPLPSRERERDSGLAWRSR